MICVNDLDMGQTRSIQNLQSNLVLQRDEVEDKAVLGKQACPSIRCVSISGWVLGGCGNSSPTINPPTTRQSYFLQMLSPHGRCWENHGRGGGNSIWQLVSRHFRSVSFKVIPQITICVLYLSLSLYICFFSLYLFLGISEMQHVYSYSCLLIRCLHLCIFNL